MLLNNSQLPRYYEAHYYGSLVRKLFLVAAIVMLISLPFLNEDLPVSAIVSLFLIVYIGIFAGLTNPIKELAIVLDTLLSVVATLTFGYFSVSYFQKYNEINMLILVNMTLSILFLITLYLSTKTLRAMIMEGSHNK